MPTVSVRLSEKEIGILDQLVEAVDAYYAYGFQYAGAL